MANYLVTGAAGFIGAAVAKRLLQEGHAIATIDNLSTGFRSNVPQGVEFFEGDCADPAIYNRIPQHRYDAILHIAGQSSGEVSFDDPIYDIRTNAESTLLLLKFALANGCHRFVYASTMSVYGKKPDAPVGEHEPCVPESFYGVAKLASEHYLRIYRKYGIESTALRLFNVYGPGQNLQNLRQGMVSIFLAQMLEKNSIHVKGSGERFRDFIYIDDVVDAFVGCIGSAPSFGECVNVATGIRTTVDDLLRVKIECHASEVDVTFAGSTEGDIHGIYAEVDKMREILPMGSLVGLDEGMTQMMAWARTQISASA